jgi:hypothetical protein
MIGLGAIIPLATETTEAGPRKHRKYKSHHKHYKKYSKGWWRQYHARQRRKRALAAQLRALRLRQLRLAKTGAASDTGAVTKGVKSAPVKPADQTVALLPSGEAAPQSWKRSSTTPGELQFRVDNSSGAQIGSAAISVVGPAMGETADRGRTQFVGGVPTTSLRRDVINRMVRENGWVVNDYQKDIGGKKVYVVVAQSQAGGGRVQSRMFYFTEVDGRIYSIATNTTSGDAERLAEESEKVLNSLARTRTPQQASVKE